MKYVSHIQMQSGLKKECICKVNAKQHVHANIFPSAHARWPSTAQTEMQSDPNMPKQTITTINNSKTHHNSKSSKKINLHESSGPPIHASQKVATTRSKVDMQREMQRKTTMISFELRKSIFMNEIEQSQNMQQTPTYILQKKHVMYISYITLNCLMFFQIPELLLMPFHFLLCFVALEYTR